MELQKPKNKVSTFREFLRTVGFGELGLCFSLAGGTLCVLSFTAWRALTVSRARVWGPLSLGSCYRVSINA